MTIATAIPSAMALRSLLTPKGPSKVTLSMRWTKGTRPRRPIETLVAPAVLALVITDDHPTRPRRSSRMTP